VTNPAKFYKGARLSGTALRGIAPLVAYKPVSESGPNSNVPQDDDALLLQLLANAVYKFACVVGYTGNATGTGDIKVGFTVPSGATIGYQLQGMTGASGSQVATNGWWETAASLTTLDSNGASSPVSAVMKGTIATAATPGTLQLVWAQHSTASTVATTVLAGSVLLAWQVQ
jgi:hypothetical protein